MTPAHPSDSPEPGRRTVLRAAALLAAVVPLAACSAVEDPLAKQAREGDNKNYIAGDGSVQEYAAESRGEPVRLTGTLYDGTDIDSSAWVGRVTVLNFWYAACAPCRVEAPHLVELYEEFQDQGVDFLGVNVRDQKATAEAFERNFKIPYPSAPDTTGSILMGLTQYVNPRAVPTTLVLDKQGRVAARVLGAIEKSTLKTLIADRVAEPA
ncbi:TlpA family protein disulfide reductase [Zafaria sp. Z1313]|uniref:TlpA family protein disulfide reductase n=1 Tax=unclassified Zafaria TaxID=2828765 RepID=UPI002E794666|nr:TlpA disulfide reductase family protein [Zafaria sp. J156]MEE1621319.1 TlpA disulfide reductase family protein [Zafaria sp. J156]